MPLLEKAGVKPDEGVTGLGKDFIEAARHRFWGRELGQNAGVIDSFVSLLLEKWKMPAAVSQTHLVNQLTFQIAIPIAVAISPRPSDGLAHADLCLRGFSGSQACHAGGIGGSRVSNHQMVQTNETFILGHSAHIAREHRNLRSRTNCRDLGNVGRGSYDYNAR